MSMQLDSNYNIFILYRYEQFRYQQFSYEKFRYYGIYPSIFKFPFLWYIKKMVILSCFYIHLFFFDSSHVQEQPSLYH
jgi:hypothetical protein